MCKGKQTPADKAKLVADDFLKKCSEGKFSEAMQYLDVSMKQKLSSEQMEQVWHSFGELKSHKKISQKTTGQYITIVLACKFIPSSMDAKFVVNADNKITSLWFSYSYDPPKYARLSSFREQDVKIVTGKVVLPGTIAIPAGKGPFPAVVLVHGSGPNDRDESNGPNKPFRDLAYGLASQGIAVLRYDKRTSVIKHRVNAVAEKMTVKEEAIDDVISAVSLLKSTKNIDHKRIFVLGHSLGGMLVPRIGKQDSSIAGFIIMAGPVRHLEDMLLQQISYISTLDGVLSEDEKKQIEEIEAAVKLLKSRSSIEDKVSILGLPREYWLDLFDYYPPTLAKELKQPMLILQGGRDYQVTEVDYDGWKKALSKQSNVSFKFYPGLNHYFFEGKGEMTPKEYDLPSHVAEYVVQDVVDWLKTGVK